jgi:hypothetical protein
VYLLTVRSAGPWSGTLSQEQKTISSSSRFHWIASLLTGTDVTPVSGPPFWTMPLQKTLIGPGALTWVRLVMPVGNSVNET